MSEFVLADHAGQICLGLKLFITGSEKLNVIFFGTNVQKYLLRKFDVSLVNDISFCMIFPRLFPISLRRDVRYVFFEGGVWLAFQ